MQAAGNYAMSAKYGIISHLKSNADGFILPMALEQLRPKSVNAFMYAIEKGVYVHSVLLKEQNLNMLQ